MWIDQPDTLGSFDLTRNSFNLQFTFCFRTFKYQIFQPNKQPFKYLGLITKFESSEATCPCDRPLNTQLTVELMQR